DLPRGGRGGQLALEPPALHRRAGVPVRLGAVGAVAGAVAAVDGEELHRPLGEGVVPLVAGQGEVVQVGRGQRGRAAARLPVVVAERRVETVDGRAGAVLAFVVADVVVVILADVGVDRRGLAGLVVVVADGDDRVRGPALHEVGNVALRDAGRSVITDHG